MSNFKVTKTIDFCYGHRLMGHQGKCRHLHGHNGMLEVDVEAQELDDLDMVVDFGDIKNVIKDWVDANLDHRMVLCSKDPFVPILSDLNEPLYIMEENPTAESISMHIFREGRRQGLNVTEVRLWETPSGYASYRED